jgi:hypothetical protein
MKWNGVKDIISIINHNIKKIKVKDKVFKHLVTMKLLTMLKIIIRCYKENH